MYATLECRKAHPAREFDSATIAKLHRIITDLGPVLGLDSICPVFKQDPGVYVIEVRYRPDSINFDNVKELLVDISNMLVIKNIFSHQFEEYDVDSRKGRCPFTSQSHLVMNKATFVSTL